MSVVEGDARPEAQALVDRLAALLGVDLLRPRWQRQRKIHHRIRRALLVAGAEASGVTRNDLSRALALDKGTVRELAAYADSLRSAVGASPDVWRSGLARLAGHLAVHPIGAADSPTDGIGALVGMLAEGTILRLAPAAPTAPVGRPRVRAARPKLLPRARPGATAAGRARSGRRAQPRRKLGTSSAQTRRKAAKTPARRRAAATKSKRAVPKRPAPAARGRAGGRATIRKPKGKPKGGAKGGAKAKGGGR